MACFSLKVVKIPELIHSICILASFTWSWEEGDSEMEESCLYLIAALVNRITMEELRQMERRQKRCRSEVIYLSSLVLTLWYSLLAQAGAVNALFVGVSSLGHTCLKLCACFHSVLRHQHSPLFIQGLCGYEEGC